MAEFFLQWERDGFAAPPESFAAQGDEILLRAYSPNPSSADEANAHGVSKRVGNCFFVPACGMHSGRIPYFSLERKKWTGAFLEERLNAFVFGNAYDRIGVWALKPGTTYKIGPVGQDTRFRDQLGIRRHIAWPSGDQTYFRQVTLQIPQGLSEKAYRGALVDVFRPADNFAVTMPISHRFGNS